jgi:hypothetical protein
MWNAFAAIELIQPFLNSCQELNPRSDLVERSFVGQLADGVEHEFFLCHWGSMGFGTPDRKRLTAKQADDRKFFYTS